jgi:putative modified peptide
MQIASEARSSARPVIAPRLTAPFDPAVADRLLDLLSTDDGYRALFQRDPRAALAQVGHVLSSDEVCFFGITLASKERLLEARSGIKGMLLSGLSQQTPKLDVGIRVGTRLL